LYLTNSLAAAASDPALYRLLTFQVPKRKSLFFLLRDPSSRNTSPHHPGEPNGGVVYLRIALSPQEASRLMSITEQEFFLRTGVVSISPNPQAVGPPLVGFPGLLIQFIHSYPPYRRLLSTTQYKIKLRLKNERALNESLQNEEVLNHRLLDFFSTAMLVEKYCH
jgi:hypothetical protein